MTVMKVLAVLLLAVALCESRKPVQGPPGSPGIPGPDGREGAPGARGNQGDPGRTPLGMAPPEVGMTGLPGFTGPKGDTGDQGYPGIDGFNGIDGPPGLPGENGQKGDAGQQGKTTHGLPGISGLPGIPGENCECTTDELIAFSGMYLDVGEPTRTHRSLNVDTILVNFGSFYNKNESSFNIPKSGNYFFSLVAVANGNSAVPVILVYKGIEILSTVGERDNKDIVYPIGTNRVALTLSQGDRIDIRVKSREGGFFGSLFNKAYSDTDVTVSAYYIN